MTLGGASFEFVGENRDLIVKSAQAAAAAKKAYDEIGKAAGVSAAAVERAAKQMAAAYVKQVDAGAAAALKTIRGYNDAADAADKAAQRTAAAAAKASGGFSDVAKSAIGFGVAATGVVTGAALVHEAMTKIATDTQSANQALFALGFTFKGTTKEMQAFAEEQAKISGKSNTDAVAALNTTRVLVTQWGYTNDQVKEVLKRSADLAALTGADLTETTRDVVAAMRLEGDVSEKYGLSLQQDAVQARLLTKAERERYQGLDPLSRAQITYGQFIDQTNSSLGAAERRTGEAAGAADNLKTATDNLSVSLGKHFAPAVAESQNVLAKAAAEATKYSDAVAKLPSEQTAAEKSMASTTVTMLSMLGPLGQLAAGYIAVRNAAGEAAKATNTSGTGPQFGPTPAEIATASARYDQLAAARRDLEQAEAELQQSGRRGEAAAQIKAAQEEHDREVKALDAKKVLLETEKDSKLKAVDDATDAALKGIETESRAAAAASDAKLAQLHAEEEAAKRAASERHDNVVAGLDAEQKATEAATEENIRNLEIERDHAKQASEDTRDAAIGALDAEKRARDASRVEEDRAAEDSARESARRESDRHEGVVKGLDDEVKAANDRKDAAIRGIEDEAKAAQQSHDQRLRQLSDETDAAHEQHDARTREIEDEADREQKQHDAAVRVIEDEGKAESNVHDATVRRISDEGDAARVTHDLATRRAEDDQRAATVIHEQRLAEIDAEGKAAQDAHDKVVTGISDEGDAAKDVHDARVNLYEDQGRVASDVHDRLLREISDEGDAADQIHDQALRAIQEQGDAEDERHRNAMDALDAEQGRRQDAVDEQLAALDALDRATSEAEQAQRLAGDVEGAKRGVQKAESTGNLSEIEAANRALADAQQAILDSQTKNARDALRDQLKAQKDAIKDQIDAEKDAESERDRILKDDLAAQKQAADDRLKLVKDELDARKQAADDDLHLTQDTLAARKREADDELKLVQDGLTARKRAADDAYDLIRDELDARKDAADAAFKIVTDDVAARKLAADDALKLVTDRLDQEKTAEDDAYKQGEDRRANETQALDDQFKQAQDRRKDDKQELDDQLKRALDRIDHEKQAEDDAFDKAKDRLDQRKVAVTDANKHELDAIAERKQAENEAHDNAVRQAQDQATQEKRAIQDRRTAEDLADKDRRDQIQKAFENEARDRAARYDDEATGEIPALRRALAAAQEHFRQRKIAADTAYNDEQQQINDLYNHPETGLIPLAQKAAAAVARSFQDQAREVNAAAKAQKGAIDDLYTNVTKTGLLDYLERARADTDDKLDKQKQYWQSWAENIAGPGGSVQKVIDKVDALTKRIQEIGAQVTIDGQVQQPQPTNNAPFQDEYHGDPGGNAAYAPVVRHAGPGTAWTSGGTHGGHPAVDIMAGRGEPIYAPIGGTVRAATYPLGGNTAQLEGDDGRGYYFAHGDRPFVGGKVTKGQQIGTVGDTGNARGGPTHLHFAISSHGTGLFGELNGSGDVTGDSSWWTNGAPMIPGQSSGGGQTVEFDLFGRHFVVTLPGGPGGNPPAGFHEMVERIRAAVQSYGIPPEVPAAIAGNEAGYQNPSRLATEWHNWFGVKGSGDAGQTPPLSTWEDFNGNGIEDPGERIMDRFAAYSSDAAAFAQWAEQFSTGRYAAARDAYQRTHRPIDYLEGLKAAGYATDANWVSQVRSIGGFKDGAYIPEPHLLINERTGAITGRMAEAGGEFIVPQGGFPGAGTGSPVNRYTVPVQLGNHTIETLVFEGVNLNIRRGNFTDIRP